MSATVLQIIQKVFLTVHFIDKCVKNQSLPGMTLKMRRIQFTVKNMVRRSKNYGSGKLSMDVKVKIC